MKKNGLSKKLSAMIAALIVVAAAVSYFVYSLVKGEPADLNGLLIEQVDGVWQVNPSDMMTMPDEPPSVEEPTTAPPAV